MEKYRKLLLETYFFSLYLEPDGTIVSGHSDGVGFCGNECDETWKEVYKVLHNHYSKKEVN